MKKVLVLFSVIYWLNANAQYIPNTTITAAQYGSTLDLPFIGGLTAPQFSDVDVNFDGINDLFIFDRGTWLPIILIKDETGNFTYHPEYANNFPALEDWVLLRDFNCDGIMDIFTYYIGSTRVYKGIEVAGEIYFTLEKSMLEYADFTGTTALYTSRTDIPAIDDIDSDGDFDILSFSVSNSTIRFYENISVESGFGCDSLLFELNELCWGSLYEGFTCYGGDLHVACKGGDAVEDENEGERAHIGSTIVTYDQDGDGDVDAILGDNSCNNLVYYRNGGSASSAEMDEKDSLWQSNGKEYNMTVFPAGFFVDYNNDSDGDLIVTTNDHQLGLNTEHIWLYENFNTNDTFDLQFQTDTFLISDIIDIGSYSKPIFFNYNNDNLPDIVAGASTTFGKSATFKYGLWLYKNTGTTTSPKFELVSKDFGGLNSYAQSHLAPASGDIDNDGDDDLLVGNFDGNIIFLENLSGGIGNAVMATPQVFYQSIDVGSNATPCLIDIEQDGKLDLIVGEANGNLNYYHNTGTDSEPIFTLESELWGGVDVRAELAVTGYSTPFMYRNENDSLYLLCGSQSGYVHQYNEIEDALLGEFFETTDNYYQYDAGNYLALNGADINNDGNMEFITGNLRGGFQIFEKDKFTPIASPEIPSLLLIPNPTRDQIHITLNNFSGANSIVSIYNIAGEKVLQLKNNDRHISISLPVTFLPGMYFVTVTTNQTLVTGTFIKL
ncbi:MAG: T9SS type A sorting domain-containing protein [Chitinophagales bacterium]|jgi:hypothetical protein